MTTQLTVDEQWAQVGDRTKRASIVAGIATVAALLWLSIAEMTSSWGPSLIDALKWNFIGFKGVDAWFGSGGGRGWGHSNFVLLIIMFGASFGALTILDAIRPSSNTNQPLPKENPPTMSDSPMNQPPQAPPQTGSPSVVHHYHEQTKTNGLAIAGMVLGIVWLYWVGSILAVIFSGIALKQIGEAERAGKPQGGKGMAIAGLVLGLIGAATLLIVIIAAASVDSGY